MRMNIYFKELRNYRKSFLFWSLGIAFLLLAAMSKYQGYAASEVSVTELFANLPAGVGAMFSLGELDLATTIGCYVIIAIYIAVMLGVHAVLLGSGIFAKEETDKTAEFLFTKPISRTQIFLSKLMAAFTLSVTLNIVSVILSIVIVSALMMVLLSLVTFCS